MKQPPVAELNNKFQEQLKEYGWYNTYRFFDFRPVLESLGTDFCPKFRYILEPFSLIRPEQVQKILIESYAVPPFHEQSYRLPYDADKHKLLETTGIELDQRQWKNTLILPVKLTNARDKHHHHLAIWKEFICYTIDVFNRIPGITWILSGYTAQDMRDYIHDQQSIFEFYSPCMRKSPGTGDMFKFLTHDELSERAEGSTIEYK